MGKSRKRDRKFVSKGGGPKAMLAKGGKLTKKGKVRSNKKNPKNKESNIETSKKEERDRVTKEAKSAAESDGDFVSESNIGDLDMDEFFNSIVEEVGDKIDKNDDDDDDDDDDDEESDKNEEVVDDEDGDSDEENVEAEEEAMKAEMLALSKSDPDFHKYLQENESSLLDFSGDKEEEEEADDEMMDGEEDEKARKKRRKVDKEEKSVVDTTANKPQNNLVIVNPKVLKSYERGAFESHGIKALKRIISAYRSACHMADTNDPNEDSTGRIRENNDTKTRTYHIESSMVFDRLMVICLKHCHEEFRYHLLGEGVIPEFEEDEDNDDQEMKDNEDEIDVNKPIHPRKMAKSTRWLQIKVSINSFMKATLHLMSEAKESKLLSFILKALENYIPFLSAFPNVGKSMLKKLIILWSSTTDQSSDYHAVRLNAFLRIRQLALTQPFPFIETVLKSSYLSYARCAKFANAASVSALLPILTFMGNSVVELYTLDYASSYQHAFIYIRQLALHLRTALQKKTPEAFRVVYCWQYLHCLKLWTAVLASSCKSSKGGDSSLSDGEANLMRSLIYPLVEIVFGVARLIPTTRHLPLRLHCVRYLQQLAAFSTTYIPTTSILLEALDLKEIAMNPKRIKGNSNSGAGDNIRGVRLPLIFKLPKVDALRTTEQLDACLGEVFLLLNREVDLYRYSAGFPEFTTRICQRLRKFSKETKNGKFRAYARGCIELCEKHAKFAMEARSSLEEAPKDIKRLEILLPANVPSMDERYNTEIGKEKRLETASQPVLSNAAKAKQKKMAVEKEEEEGKVVKKRKKRKKKSKTTSVNEVDLKNVDALQEQDEVELGVNWSDSDSDDKAEA